MSAPNDMKEAVREKYSQAALRVKSGGGGCCAPAPAAIRRSLELWAGCIAGALSEDDYRGKLAAAGFADIGLEVTRVYGGEDARAFLAFEGFDADAPAREVDGKFVSAFVRARKP